MKHLRLLLLLAVGTLLVSCTKEGDIQSKSAKPFVVNGKKYKFLKVIPCDNCGGVWIMYPLDSLTPQPITTMHEVDEETTETLIQIK